MNATECIKGRRSIRKFKADAIDHALLSEVIETASYYPSWKHTQIVRFVAIEGALKDKIAEEATNAWPNNGTIIKSAPVLMAITIINGRSGYEKDGSFSTPRGTGWENFDAGIASNSFCLAAYEKGLGSVILGIFDQKKVEELIQLPEGRELVALIPVGYADEEPTCPRRKPVEDLLSFM